MQEESDVFMIDVLNDLLEIVEVCVLRYGGRDFLQRVIAKEHGLEKKCAFVGRIDRHCELHQVKTGLALATISSEFLFGQF